MATSVLGPQPVTGHPFARCPLRGCPVVAQTEAGLRLLVEHVRVHRAEDDPPKSRVTFSYPVPPLRPSVGRSRAHGVEYLRVGAGLATAAGTAQEPAAATCLVITAGLATATGAALSPAAARTAGLATATGSALAPVFAVTMLTGIIRTAQRRAITVSLLADPSRSNRIVAREAGSDHTTVRTVRHELEQAGEIGPFRASPARLTHAPSLLRQRATAELLADPCRDNAEIGAATGTTHSWIWLIRHELERSGAIPVWRGVSGPPPGTRIFPGQPSSAAGRWAAPAPGTLAVVPAFPPADIRRAQCDDEDMDPVTLGLLQQSYAKTLATMAAGQSASPDVFSTELEKQVAQGWAAEVPGA